MRILLSPDKFKGSLSSDRICTIIDQRIKEKLGSHVVINKHPMADGGDGSLKVLAQFIPFEKIFKEVKDPIGETIDACYCVHKKTAYIELAIASGIANVAPSNRNPRLTSTYGTGQLINDAIEKGCNQILLFLGGSCTNDAGVGIASALGFNFLDSTGNALEAIGDNLYHIDRIEYKGTHDFKSIEIQILCDVTNPLYGPNGAAHVYGKQKGASPEDILYLDKGLVKIAQLFKNYSGIDVQTIPGTGAAGGIGAGLMTLCNAQLVGGFEMLSKITELSNAVKESDIIISGEGRIDDSSFQGKVIGGVFNLTQKYNKELILVCGVYDHDSTTIRDTQLPIFEISAYSKNLEDAMLNAEQYLLKCCDKIVEYIKEDKGIKE